MFYYEDIHLLYIANKRYFNSKLLKFNYLLISKTAFNTTFYVMALLSDLYTRLYF